MKLKKIKKIFAACLFVFFTSITTCLVHAEGKAAVTQVVDVTEKEEPEIIEANEEVLLGGITRKNKMTIYPRCAFNIKEGQTFYIEYHQSISGRFEVGLIDDDGEKLEADTVLCEENDVTSIQVDKDGIYYFYLKGSNEDAGLFNTSFSFNCYFK